MSIRVLLGPQRFDPTVATAAEQSGIKGRIALITAGWQERESEDEALSEHLAGSTVNLELHRRANDIFRRDEALRKAHRSRQQELIQLQDFYRVRLNYLMEAAHVISLRAAPPALLAQEHDSSVESLRMLDRYHLSRCRAIHRTFWQQWQPHEREVVAEHRAELRATLDDCAALAIAGGHVATILNRLHLFGIAELIAARPVLAWSAGAMAITERVVLFHDNPPHGVSAPQLLDGGIGLLDDVVALPNPQVRLRLDEPDRVSMYAKRFAPASCLALPRRAWAIYRSGRLIDADGVLQLQPDGSVTPLQQVVS